jgi:hypothetical protein
VFGVVQDVGLGDEAVACAVELVGDFLDIVG